MKKVLKFIDDYVLLLPIVVALAVIPLIHGEVFYDPKLSSFAWFPDGDFVKDTFNYYKSKAMVVLDGVLVVVYIYLWIRKKLVSSNRFIPLILYLLLIALSSIFSISPAQTWYGFYDMLETAYVLFGYCMLCYYAYVVVRTDLQLKLVMGGFLLGIVGMGTLGFLTYIKGARVSATFGNSNYMGVYVSILIPLFVVLMFSVKKRVHLVFYTVIMALVLLCFEGSGSKSALLALIPCVIFIACYFGKNYWREMIPVALICGGIFLALNIFQGEDSLVSKTKDRVSLGIKSKKVYDLTDITLNDEDYTVTYKGETLVVKYIENEDGTLDIEIADENGNELKKVANEENDGYVLEDDKYSGLEFVLDSDEVNHAGYSVKVGKYEFFIYHSSFTSTYWYTNYYGEPTKMYSSETYDSVVFRLMGGFSGRDYIWSKSIPLLKDTIILGSGPDTFAIMFPQSDYVSLVQSGAEKVLITKPHSLYLQIGVQTGVLSLIAFLVFHIGYLVQSVKLYRNRRIETFAERCGAGIFVATISYLITCLANDSTIGVSSVYWTLLGTGFACNAIIQRKIEKAIE